MSRFVNRQATDKITLANGDKVEVRQRLIAAEESELTRCLMRLRFDSKSGQVDIQEGDWHLQRIAIVKAYLVGWTFTDDEGNPVTFEPGIIDDLDGATITEIAQSIDKLQADRTAVNAKNASKP